MLRPIRLTLAALLVALCPCAASAQFIPPPPLPPPPTPTPTWPTTFEITSSGWSVSGSYEGGPYHVEAQVQLTQDAPLPGPTPVDVSSDQVLLDPAPTGVLTPYSEALSNIWNVSLSPGTWYGSLQLTWYSGSAPLPENLLFVQTLVSDPLIVPFTDPRTPGYWKNHTAVWGFSTLALGATTYQMTELLDILDSPVRGDITIILAKHMIAARLNVAAGSDPVILSTLSNADAYLAVNPVGSKPGGQAKSEGAGLKDALDDYNNGL